MKKFFLTLVVCIFLFFITDLLLEGLYTLFFNSPSYMTFSHPYSFIIKWIILGVLIVSFLYYLFRFSSIGEITPFGRVFFPALLLLLGVGFLFAFINFSATNEKGVIEQKIWGRIFQTWDDVSYISTMARIPSYNEKWRRVENPQVILEYRIHFKDGSSINAWDDINSLKNLHMYVKQNEIAIEHQPVDQEIRENLRRYIKGDRDIVKEILYIP